MAHPQSQAIQHHSQLERVKFENEILSYSDGVVARTEAPLRGIALQTGKNIIRKGDFVLREDDHLFVPALWREKEIITYSRLGYEDKTWLLPDDWRDVKHVDLYSITAEGLVPLKMSVPVTDGNLLLTLEEDEAISIVTRR